MLTGVQIVHVPVSDQDAAFDFYVERLGLSVVADLEMGPHGRWLQVAPESAATTLALVVGDDESPPGSVRGLVLETSDIDADVAALRERGIEVGDVEDLPWARMARMVDPDGNEILLQTATTTHE